MTPARLVLVLACTLLGLVIGSFLNVVVHRVPRGESVVTPRSRCPHCGAAISARDNVPVLSWLLLRGRCRSCAGRISGRYPLVELLTAGAFAALGWRLGASAALPAFLYLGAVGVALALIDLDVRRLPNVIVLPSYGVAGVLLAVAAVVDRAADDYLRGLAGMAALFGFYFALALLHPAGMGFGDVKLAGVLGLYLGYLGWGPLVAGAFLGFLLGGVASAVLLLARRATRRSAIPFGPFMILGAFAAVLWGEPLASAYFDSLH